MNFNPIAPLDPKILLKAKNFMGKLPALQEGQYFTHIYLHWPVEPFTVKDENYNCETILQGTDWVMVITQDPRHNAVNITGGPYAAHTFQRNSHGLGCAISGMDGATTSNFGPDGIQLHELDTFCGMVAACAVKYGIDSQGYTTSSFSDHEHTIMTHAEAAITQNYFGERWDLERLQGEPGVPLTPQEAVQTASLIRERIHLYAAAIKGTIHNVKPH